ncbi:MAG: Stp1/IreP family PP2C-type Ser/Thr phosphatase [Pseudomonadota bacterium]
MEGTLKTQICGLTDPGRVRKANEDAVSWDAEAGWVVLADGMGGHMAGEVASGIAVETLAHSLGEQPLADTSDKAAAELSAAVARANARIHEQARTDIRCHNMGTTLIAGLFYDRTLVSAHVGDSRLYLYRDADLVRLSHDHSLVQEMVDEGMMSPEEAAESTHKNVITRALGLEATVQVDLLQHHLQPGDLYLFCSDGLTDKIDDAELGEFLRGEDLAAMSQRLVDESNARGGEDNISVILVRII